jgi:programmed cell death protein 5
MEDDEDLERLRRRRLQQLEMESKYQEAAAQQQAAAEAELAAQRQAVMRRILTPEARDRVGRLRTAHPELAASLEDQLIMLAQQGRLTRQIADGELRSMLREISPKKREIKITFKK